jgi:hypothetical protein
VKRVIGYVVVPVLAFFIARLTVTSSTTIEPARETVVQQRTTQVITRGDNEGLRAIIREELAATTPSAAAPAIAPAATELPAKVTEPSASLVRAMAIIDNTRASGGRWGEQEREQFRAELHQLAGDEAFQAARSLAAAINQQRLVPDGPVL